MSIFRLRSNESTNRSTLGLSSLSVEPLEERMMLSTVEIIAAGTQGGEQFELQVAGFEVATFTAEAGADTGDFQTFTFETDRTVRAGDIRIAFVNDSVDPVTGADSNLRVDAIVVDGFRTETESPFTSSTGTYLPGQGIQFGQPQSETLHANGFFQYQNVGDDILIRARGDEGGEQFNVILDGQVAATFTTTTSLQTFRLSNVDNVGIADVDIEFFGDVFDANQGIDTNLFVDYVTIDGIRHNTEANTTFSTGTYLDADGIQPGFRQSETLHTNGIFSFLDPGQSSSSTIQVRASGFTGTEQFRVLSGGVLLGEFNAVRGGQIYEINTNNYTPGSNLRIELTG